MTKSFYFQHDYNSANDHKVLFLRQQFGIEGYGIYWYVIEQLAQNGGILPLKIIPVIAMQIQTTADKVNAVIKNYELFTIDDDLFFSARLMKQIEYRNQLSEDGRAGALKRWGNKAENSPPISIPNAKERKGKERKERKEKNYDLPFESDAFKNTWSEWIEYRKDRRFTLSNVSTKKQLNFLKTYPERDAIHILNSSIMNGWQGLFPPKQSDKKEPVNKYKVQ